MQGDVQKESIDYKELTPVNDIKDGEEYLKALKWALANARIKNIALAGPYGSGKSSIIETHIENENLDNYLKISMATFNKTLSDDDNESEQGGHKQIEIGVDEIERGILQQLFYKVKPKKIPQSRYRKLYPINEWHVRMKSLVLVVFLTFTMILFAPDVPFSIWNNMKACIGLDAKWVYAVIAIIYVIILTFIISHLWCWLIPRYHIKEIGLPAKGKLEEHSVSSDSVFNKNLDEIVYFFEATKTEIVFFEDLDRLSDRRVFVHLRELNNLLNNDDAIKKKPIVFVYAVRDDIFTREDRTKFFDFIIPVIPIANSTNSGDILLEKLNVYKDNNISQDFIFDISPYISDMRVLQNICNEFITYKNTLKTYQGLPLSDKKMISMIIFKNLYPRDFADIQAENGIIKKAFLNKNTYIQRKKAELQEEIDAFSEVIEKAQGDCLESTREIKIVMLTEITENRGIVTGIGKQWRVSINATRIMDDSFDMYELDSDAFDYIEYNSFSKNNETMTISGFKEKIAPYIERWEHLRTLEEESEKKIQQEIADKKEMQHALTGKSIKSIMANNDDFEFDEDISHNKLLIFMLRRGYIDEEYANYINYFKGNSITTDDMKYILSIKDQEPKPFDYSLTKIPMIIRRLQQYEFEQKAIYNFDLMEQLLADDGENSKRDILIHQLSDESEVSWNFIDEFVDRTEYKEKFIKLLCYEWSGIWEFISGRSTLQYERQLYYLSMFFNILEDDDLEKLNINNSIKDYIEKHSDILQKISVNISKDALCSVLTKFKISFSSLEFSGVSNDVIDYVLDNCLYDLNEEMIFNVVSYKNRRMASGLTDRPYTTIIALGYEKLINYVHCNFVYYIENIVLVGKTLEDREDLIIIMLEKLFPNGELCIKLVQYEQFQTENIESFLANCIKDDIENEDEEDHSEVVHEIWNSMLINEKIKPTWENVAHFWGGFSFSEELCEYIASHVNDLAERSTCCCDDNFIKGFITDAECNNDVYKKLLPYLKMSDFDLPLGDLSEDMINLMVDINYFEFTVARYEYISEHYHDIAINYIIKNQKKFIEQVEKIEMSTELLSEILNNASIRRNIKYKLFDMFAEEYMSAGVVEYILENRIEISKSCFSIAWNYASGEQKERLFMDNLEMFNADDFEKCFNDLHEKYEKFADRSKAHVISLPDSEDNLKLAKCLEETGYISSYNIKVNKRSKTIRYSIRKKTI